MTKSELISMLRGVSPDAEIVLLDNEEHFVGVRIDRRPNKEIVRLQVEGHK